MYYTILINAVYIENYQSGFSRKVKNEARNFLMGGHRGAYSRSIDLERSIAKGATHGN